MKDDGGPAFPKPMSVTHGGIHEHQSFDPPQEGMSLRDWFAGLAMQGMFAADTGENCILIDRKAYLAYLMADEMLKARGS